MVTAREWVELRNLIMDYFISEGEKAQIAWFKLSRYLAELRRKHKEEMRRVSAGELH